MDKRDSVREMLSPRERQLLELSVSGKTDQAIANTLGISLATVGTYWGRVRIKFGPFNRTELVAIYLRDEADNALADLKTKNQALITEIDNHSKSEEELRAGLDLYKSFISTAPDAILIVEESGVISVANGRAAEMFGYEETELVGKAVEDLLPDRYLADHARNRTDYLEHPKRKQMGEHEATLALKKGGVEFAIAATLNATESLRGRLVTCIIRDLSEGREAVSTASWQAAGS